MDVRELARRVLMVLDLQQEYFRRKNPLKLVESKQEEAKLRELCKGILTPPDQRQQTLPGMT